jgi:2-O-methyltransferase
MSSSGSAIMTLALWDKVRGCGVFGIASAIYRKLAKAIWPSVDPNFYLKRVTGVVHVGANLGQERGLYAKYELKVLWIEPLPDVFGALCKNIAAFPEQKAVNHLITDKDDTEYLFHVASNGGASSSILELGEHSEIWPDVHYVSKLALRSITLDSLLEKIGNDRFFYQALVIDTQGSELLVLKGAAKSLSQFRFIKTEAANFESYVHCARIDQLTEYLSKFGFELIRSDKFAESGKGGQYFDLLYQKS